MKKRIIFLGIYGIVVIAILVYILFFASDDFFLSHYNQDTLSALEEASRDFEDFEVQKQNLEEANYDYEYQIMESLNDSTVVYKCTGKVTDDTEVGSCTSPELVAYSETDKDKVYDKVNRNYLNPSYVFDLISDVEPEVAQESSKRSYSYSLKLTSDELDSDIVIYTDKDNIYKIEITNAYEVYILNYSNLSY